MLFPDCLYRLVLLTRMLALSKLESSTPMKRHVSRGVSLLAGYFPSGRTFPDTNCRRFLDKKSFKKDQIY